MNKAKLNRILSLTLNDKVYSFFTRRKIRCTKLRRFLNKTITMVNNEYD